MKQGYIYSIVSAILFGSAGFIIKYAYLEGSNPVNLLILQYIIATILMFSYILLTNKALLKISRKALFHCAVLGIVGNTFMTVFYYTAMDYLTIPIVAILLYTYPIIVFIYTVIFEHEKIDSKKILLILVAFLGCYLSLGISLNSVNISIVGLISGLAAAFFYSFMNIYSGKRLPEVNSITVNFYSTAFSLLSLVIYSFPFYLFKGQVTVRLLIYTSLLSVFCEIIPLTLLYAAIKKIGSLKTSVIGNLEIPTAMLLSYFCLGQKINSTQIIGAAMVAYAVYRIK